MIDLMANRLPEVKVLVRKLPIPAELVGGNYQDDRTYRAQFQQWMNSLWVQKDAEIAAMLEGKA
ncbi:putative acyltransferase YihG [compost metagenome]